MGQINWGRVILGGLLAGLVINISEFVLNAVILADEMRQTMESLGKDPEGGSLAVWLIYGFVLGIAGVWLYAAIRPRYGPGIKTAFCAAVAAWFLAVLLPSVGFWNMDLFPAGILAFATIWALVEMGVAVTLGAWLYQEEG